MNFPLSFSNRSAGIFRLFFFCLPALSIGQVYKGSIDKYPIIFEVAKDESVTYEARYYYKSVKKDIFLRRETNEKHAYASDKNTDGAKEYFYLKENGEQLNGNWKMGGKTFTVQLTKVKDGEVKSNYNTKELNYLKETDLYTFMKLENISFKKTREENWNGECVLEWYSEPLTKIEFFRIKSCAKISNIAGVNKFLQEKHIEEVIECAGCTSWGPMGGDYSFSASLTFISDQLLSIYCSTSYYCGGAHPDFSNSGITLDHRKMKKLKLSDLYWFDDKKKYNPAMKGDLDEQMKNFGSTWNAVVKKEFPEEMKTNNNPDECNYDDESIWSLYSWGLNRGGLRISAFFARVMRSCDTGNDWPVVPFLQIDKYRVNKDKYQLP